MQGWLTFGHSDPQTEIYGTFLVEGDAYSVGLCGLLGESDCRG